MKVRRAQLAVVSVISVASATAWAGPSLDEDTQGGGTSTEDATGAPATAATTPTGNEVEYGVGVRLRYMTIPKGLVELFVEHSAGGTGNVGFGIEGIRRRGSLELQVGIEFEHVTPGEGPWIKKGDDVSMGDEADYILDPENAPSKAKLGWVTLEFTIVSHTKINKNFAIRYGVGGGLGILTGDLYRQDVICSGATNADPEPGCVPTTRGGSAASQSEPIKYDLPPVFPVLNALVGVQIRPIDKMVINVEGGIRTFPFFGASTAYFF
ncbi:MAG: hypothetical protein AB7O24_03390 [Kofleriaceae bacterium]